MRDEENPNRDRDDGAWGVWTRPVDDPETTCYLEHAEDTRHAIIMTIEEEATKALSALGERSLAVRFILETAVGVYYLGSTWSGWAISRGDIAVRAATRNTLLDGQDAEPKLTERPL